MQRVVFHIGLPKTGSTALQVFLARNSAALRSRSCDYFEIGEAGLGRVGRISSGNGAYLARSLLPAGNPARMPDSVAPIREFLQAVDASDCELGIVSSELFVDATHAEFKSLLLRLREVGVCPCAFYFIREQDQFLSSSYVQQVKRHGLTAHPDTFAKTAHRHIPYLLYMSWFGIMTSLFEREDIFCRTYEGAMHNEHSIFGTFCSALNLSLDGLDLDVSDVNTGMTTQELMIMARLNKYRPRMRFSDLVVENSQLAGQVHSGETYNLFSPEIQQSIREFFREENLAFARSYFNRDELFFVRMKGALNPSYAETKVEIDDVIAFTGGLLVRYDDRLAKLEARLGATESRIGAVERKPVTQ